MNRLSGLQKLGIFGLVAWLLLPLLLAAISIQQNRSVELTPQRHIWAQVEAQSEGFSAPVDLALTWSAAPKLIAPAWQGTVQEVYAKTGGTLRSGDAIARINGVKRVALHTDTVLFRSLQVGDNGTDVAALCRSLQQRRCTVFDRSLLKAVREFARTLDVPRPGTVTAFDPAWVVYLPVEQTVVARTNLTMAAPAPGPGSEIIVGRPRLTGTGLYPRNTVVQPEAANGQSAGGQRAEPVKATNGDSLRVGEKQLPLNPNHNGVSEASWHTLAAQVTAGARGTSAWLVSPPDPEGVLLPAASIAQEPNESTVCRRRNGQDLKVPVTLGSVTETGAVRATGDVRATDLVRVPAHSGSAPC